MIRAAVFLFCSSARGLNFGTSKAIMETNNVARWEAIWAKGIEPGQVFDAAKPSPCLVKLLNDNEIPEGRALVPGCGRGYDVLLLASDKRKVLGIEIAEGAIKAAKTWLESLPPHQQPPTGSAEFQLQSFFDLPSDTDEAKFDFIYDYTFLCALDPSIRTLWASKMADLIKPGGELLTLIFPISEIKEGGPPFKVSLEAVKNLLTPVGFESFQLELLPSDLCHEGRDGIAVGIDNITGPYAT